MPGSRKEGRGTVQRKGKGGLCRGLEKEDEGEGSKFGARSQGKGGSREVLHSTREEGTVRGREGGSN